MEEEIPQNEINNQSTSGLVSTEPAIFGKSTESLGQKEESEEISDTTEPVGNTADWIKSHLFFVILVPMIVIWLVLVVMIFAQTKP